MTGSATRTERRDAVNGGKRLFVRPLLVFLLSAAASFLLGAFTRQWGSWNVSPEFLDTAVWLGIAALLLTAAALATVSAVWAINSQDAFLGGAVLGVLMFILILS